MASHTKLHASEHIDGTDDIQLASATQKGLMSPYYADIVDRVAPISGGLSQLDDRFVNVTGDTMTGSLVISGGDLTVSGTINGGVIGGVTKVGTPVDNQVGVWTGDGTIEGDANLTYDGTGLTVGGTSNITISPDFGGYNFTGSATTSNGLTTYVSGDSAYRISILAGGTIEWGNGSIIDTNLYRASSNVLKTDDAFESGGNQFRFNGGVGTIDYGSATMSFTDETNGTVTLTEIADAIDNYVEYYLDSTVGDNSTNPITITHNLGTQLVDVVIMRNSDNKKVDADITFTDENNISITFASTPTLNQYSVKCTG